MCEAPVGYSRDCRLILVLRHDFALVPLYFTRPHARMIIDEHRWNQLFG
jgi:hypothetical protein